MRRDGVILHRRTEFVPDLFVDCFDDFFAGEHKKPFVVLSLTPVSKIVNLRSKTQKPRARFQARGFCSGDVLLTHSLPLVRLTAFPSMSALPRASILLQPAVVLE